MPVIPKPSSASTVTDSVPPSLSKFNSFDEKIYSKIDLLKTFSLTGVKIEDEEARILHFENYSLVYKIIKNIIYILAFWDNRQNPSKLLKILKLK